MSETENENENDSTPRFNKATIGRILAVGLFVVLGSFAVIQSMKGKKTEHQEQASATDSEDSETSDSDGNLDVSKIQADTNDTASKIANDKNPAAQSNTTASTRPIDPRTSGFKTSLSPIVENSTPSSRFGNSGSMANTPPPQTDPNNGFSRQPATPFVAAKTPTDLPVARVAQVGNGPLGGSSSFGVRPEAPTVESNPINSQPIQQKLGAAVENVSEKAKAGVENLSDTLVDGAENSKAFLKATSEGLMDTAENTTSRITGLLNDDSPNGSADGTNRRPNPVGPPNSNPGDSSKAPNVGGFGGAPPTNFAAPPFVAQQNPGFANGTPPPNEPSPSAGALSDLRPRQTMQPINARSEPTGQSKSPFAAGGPSNGTGSVTGVGPADASSSFATQPRQPEPNNLAASRTQRSFGNTPPDPRDQPASQAPNIPSSSGNQAGANQVGGNPIGANPIGGNPVAAQPVSANITNNRPASRLGSNELLSEAPSGLTQNTPGDRELEGVQAAALIVEKISPREIQVNQTADFQLVVKNVGRVLAEGVQVFDQVPAGTEFQGSTPEPSQLSRTGVQWDIGSLRPGQEKRINIQLKPIQPGEIGSVTTVTSSTQASMRTLVTKPVLEITQQTQPTHLIGGNVLLNVVVTNKGDGPANNVLIQEDVPPQLEFQDGYRELEFEIGTLMPGQSRTVPLSLKAAEVGKLQNIIFASADGGLQAKHELPLEIVAPNLIAKSDGPTFRYLERSATHRFTVANRGTASATNVELIARLPGGLRYVDSNNQGTYQPSAHAVFWSLDELARDVEANVEVETMPVDVGNQPIKFETFADLNVRSEIEQPLNVEHLVDLFFDIDDVVDPIEIGSETSYRVKIVNQGTKAATNVQFQVEFPNGLVPKSVEGSLRHNINGQQIVFDPINSLSPGDGLSFVIHATGQSAGDHRVVLNMRTDGRQTPVSKEETTRVYADR